MMRGKKRSRRDDTHDIGRTVVWVDSTDEDEMEVGGRWSTPATSRGVVLSEQESISRPIDFGYTLRAERQPRGHQSRQGQQDQQRHSQQDQQRRSRQQQLHYATERLLAITPRPHEIPALSFFDKVLGWGVGQLCQEDEEASIDALGTRMTPRPAAFGLDMAAADVDSAWRQFLSYWGAFAREETRACLRTAIEGLLRNQRPGVACRLANHEALGGSTLVLKLLLPDDYERHESHLHVGACFLLNAGSHDGRSVLGIVTPLAKQQEEQDERQERQKRQERQEQQERQERQHRQERQYRQKRDFRREAPSSYLYLSVHSDSIPALQAMLRGWRGGELRVSYLAGLINFHRYYNACYLHQPAPPPFAEYLLGRRVRGQEEDDTPARSAGVEEEATLAALAKIHPTSARVVDYVKRVFAHGRCASGIDAAHARQQVVSLFAQVKSHMALDSFPWHAEAPPRLLSAVGNDAGLNEAQRRAFSACVSRVLALPSSLSHVQGPPGTGKTHFFAWLALTMVAHAATERAEQLRIRRLCSNNRKRRHDDESDDGFTGGGGGGDEEKRVLCCGPSNKAVVVAAEAFLKVLATATGGSLRGLCPRVVVTGVEERLRAGMDDDDNDEDGSSLRPLLALLQVAEALAPSELLRRLQRPRSLLDVLPKFVYSRFLGSIRFLRRAVMASEGSHGTSTLGREVRAVMDLAEFFGVTKKGDDNDDDDDDDDRYYEDEGRRRRGLRRSDINIARTLREVASRVRSLGHANNHAVQQLLDDALWRLEDEGEHREAAAHLLRCSQIVFCTLSSSGSATFVSVRSHVLLVDEAAMAGEADLLIPLRQEPLHLILVGDPQQLGCFVESKQARAQRADSSSMTRLMHECGFESSMLQVQYRMHPEICAFPNETFYAGRLENDGITAGPFRSAPWIGTRVPDALRRSYVFVNTDGAEEAELGGMSLINTHECDAVLKILSDMLPLPSKKIVVISFYLAQVRLIQARLAEMGGAYASVRVYTADSVQGSEADVVILSFVRSNLRGSVGFLKNYRRLNVALTRAKSWLLCVGNFSTLRRCRFWLGEAGVQSEAAVVTALAGMAQDAHNRGLVVDFA